MDKNVIKNAIKKVNVYIKDIVKEIDTRVAAFLTGIFFIITMLPIWYLAFYARPSGDDYGYSMNTHQTWIHTHSLIEVFKTALETTKSMCNTWNGDWFTVFLFTWMPEVFVTYSFWIVPIVMTTIVIAGTVSLSQEILVKRLGMKWYEGLMVAFFVLTASYQFIPSTAVGMYWYVGAVHYMLPHAIGLFLLVFLSRFERTEKAGYIVLSAIGTVMIGGSSYFTSLLVFMVYICVMMLCFKKKRSILWIGIPFITGCIALYFQITAPGNAKRGGPGFGFSIRRIAETVFLSFVKSFTFVAEYIKNKTFIFLLLIVMAVLLWECLNHAKSRFSFPLPGVFVLFMYGFYTAMFAPELYAAVEVSLGPATMEYFTFVLCAAASIVYVEGWAIEKRKEKGCIYDKEKYRIRMMMPAILLCCLITFFFRGMLSESVFKRSVEYVVSGQAKDFKEQIASQMEILLDDSIKEAYLCPINDKQGPLMHMPVTENPEAFTNWAVAGFYGKDKVIMRRREQE